MPIKYTHFTDIWLFTRTLSLHLGLCLSLSRGSGETAIRSKNVIYHQHSLEDFLFSIHNIRYKAQIIGVSDTHIRGFNCRLGTELIKNSSDVMWRFTVSETKISPMGIQEVDLYDLVNLRVLYTWTGGPNTKQNTWDTSAH